MGRSFLRFPLVDRVPYFDSLAAADYSPLTSTFFTFCRRLGTDLDLHSSLFSHFRLRLLSLVLKLIWKMDGRLVSIVCLVSLSFIL